MINVRLALGEPFGSLEMNISQLDAQSGEGQNHFARQVPFNKKRNSNE